MVVVQDVVVMLVVECALVVVVVSQPLHVLVQLLENSGQRFTANKAWHVAKVKLFVLLLHRCDVLVVVVVVDVLVLLVVVDVLVLVVVGGPHNPSPSKSFSASSGQESTSAHK